MSSDHSSPVYDMLSGKGDNLPMPSGKDYAHRLFDIAERLNKACLLKEMVEMRRVREQHTLSAIMSHCAPDRFEELKDWVVVHLSLPTHPWDQGVSLNDKMAQLFILSWDSEVTWALTSGWRHARAWEETEPITNASYTELDVDSFADLIDSLYPQFAYDLLDWLTTELIHLRNFQRKKLQELEAQTAISKRDLQLFAAVLPGRPRVMVDYNL